MLQLATHTDHEHWDAFFEYLTSGSAAILGLAFLAFSLNAEHWRGHPLRERIALMNLAELSAPLFFGLIFLMPTTDREWGAVLTGLLGIGTIAWFYIGYFMHQEAVQKFEFQQALLAPIGLITFPLLIGTPSLTVKACTLVWMIFSGLSESWTFLVVPQSENAPEPERAKADGC